MRKPVGEPDILTFDNFFSSYNRFAIQKKLPTLKRSRMEAYAFSGSLDLSVARAPDGQVLVWHSYYSRAITQLYTQHHFFENLKTVIDGILLVGQTAT